MGNPAWNKWLPKRRRLKRTTRDDAETLVDAYLARGGKVQQIPAGKRSADTIPSGGKRMAA